MTMTLKVDNVKCGGCVSAIKNRLLSIAGIDSVEVEIETGRVRIVGARTIDQKKVVSDLEGMGYPLNLS